MSKINAEVKLTVDSETAQNMLCCAGYEDKKRSENELVSDLLSILGCYGVKAAVTSVTKQSLKNCGCKICQNDSLVLPASHLGMAGTNEFRKWLQSAREQKKFLFQVEREKFTIIDECPFCHYQFTEEDYDDFKNGDDNA